MTELTAVVASEDVKTKPVGITKSEFVRAEFQNVDYLAFNGLHSRIVFADNDLTSQKSRVETVKFAVKFTALAVNSIIGSDGAGLFIEDDEKALIARIEAQINQPLIEKLDAVNGSLAPLLRDLSKINIGIGEDAESVTISLKDWSAVMLKVIALKG